MDGTPDQTDAILAEWCALAAAELGLAGRELTAEDRNALLGLAGVAAHKVTRPAAPLTTFLAGYAAGLRAAPEAATDSGALADAEGSAGHDALADAIAKLTALAKAYADTASHSSDAQERSTQ